MQVGAEASAKTRMADMTALKLKAIAVVLCISAASYSFADSCAEVFFVSFGIELYMPKAEDTIEVTAFEHLYVKSEYLERIAVGRSNDSAQKKYQPNNTRALVRGNGQEYFIDRDGVMRHANKFYQIDSQEFEGMLAKECKEN